MENKNYDSILNECIDKTEKLTISDKKPNKGTGAGGSNKNKRHDMERKKPASKQTFGQV